MPKDRSDIEIFQKLHASINDDHRKCLPAVITNVNSGRNTVDVAISVQNPLLDDDGNVTFETLPPICDVPLATPRGGGFIVHMPVAVGDSVMLVFSDLCTDTWRASDGPGAVAPGFIGKHTAASAFAFPCVAPDAQAPTQPASTPTDLVIGKDNSDAQIHITPTDISLGRNPSGYVAMSNLVATELGKIATAFASFNPGTGGASFATPYLFADVGSTAALHTKAQ